MSEQTSGSKTEKPTPKKQRDSRQKGDIAKSRDVTNTLLLLMGVGLFWQLGPQMASRLEGFLILVLEQSPSDVRNKLSVISAEAIKLLLSLCALAVLPMALFGMLCEFLQTGPLFTLSKVAPKLSNLDPVAGVKRMISTDSLVELIKSIVKILIVTAIAVITAMQLLPDALKLPHSQPGTIAVLVQSQTIMLFGWALIIFVSVALLDFAYQKYSHTKKMMMSLQDIKQEHKNSEGDPHVKGQRQQLAREWAQEGASKKAQDATVLVVNPTHIAIALKYERGQTPVPIVTAHGVDETALAMRRAAQKAEVPVLKNIKLARTLLAKTNSGDFVPRELFDIISEVILWAHAVDKTLKGEFSEKGDQALSAIPGEDLTHYSADFHDIESQLSTTGQHHD